MVDVRGDVLRPPHGTTPAASRISKTQLNSLKFNVPTTKYHILAKCTPNARIK